MPLENAQSAASASADHHRLMKVHARALEFEKAAFLRDEINLLKKRLPDAQYAATMAWLARVAGVPARVIAPVPDRPKVAAIAGNAAQHRIKLIADQFPDTNAAAKALLDRAWTDPKLAQHLLDFPTTDAQVYEWSKTLNRMLNLNRAGQGEPVESRK